MTEEFVADPLVVYEEPLKRVLNDFELETTVVRREYIRKCLKMQEMFRGNQWQWWNAETWTYRPTYNLDDEDGDQNLWALNFFQGFALALISLLGNNKLPRKFWPEDPNNHDDVLEARRRESVINAFVRGESDFSTRRDMVYSLACDGTFGSYVYMDVDGQRYGTKIENQPKMEMVPSDPNDPNSPLMETQIVQSVEVEGRKLRRDIVSGMELHLPPYCDSQEDFPYLLRKRELPRGTVRAKYQEQAERIKGVSPILEAGSGTRGQERASRIQARSGTDVQNHPVSAGTAQSSLVTFTEAWFRPTAFWQLDDVADRDMLIRDFPKGVYAAFADGVLVDVREESMDDHWSICHGLPGRGQIREPILGSLAQVQELANHLVNIISDIIEYTLPMTLIENQILDTRTLRKQKVAAGGMISVSPRGSSKLEDGVFQTQPGVLPQYATTFLDNLRGPYAEFASGAFSAAFGGGTPGNETAQGIEIQRNSALGRISLFLKSIIEHETKVSDMIVNEFARYGVEPMRDVRATSRGFETVAEVNPEDLGTGRAKCYAEIDEEFPTTWAQQQALTLQMMANPLLQGVFGLIANTDQLKRVLGTKFEFPGENAYESERIIINQLLQEQPVEAPPMPQIDPMTGQPVLDEMGAPVTVPSGPPTPSIMPNPQLEGQESMVMYQACLDFYMRPESRELEKENGPGWQNFILHMMARQMAMMPPAMPPAGGGGGEPSSDNPEDESSAEIMNKDQMSSESAGMPPTSEIDQSNTAA